jgi:beta-glucosidase
MKEKSIVEEYNLLSEDFGSNFNWGVSVSAYQIEGAHDLHDKGPSIWDVFSSKKKNILNGHHGNDACNFYHKFDQDLELLKSLNIKNFRFSLSWPRIMPDGITVNPHGISFYNQLIDKCLELDITPWVTLYHWDLPHVLEEKGGWTNRQVLQWFSNYVETCAKTFGDRIKNWMVLNEPLVFTGAGYFLGVHAPGKKRLKNFIPAMHHACLCQAEGGRILRAHVANANIGTTFSCSHIDPYSTKEKDVKAAYRIDALVNRLFIEPTLGLGYPLDDLKALKAVDKYFLPGDDKLLQFDFDFIGLQTYTREVVKHSYFIPYLHATIVTAEKRNVSITGTKWEIYPPGIYHILKKFNRYTKVKKIFITENGVAFADELISGEVKDDNRTKYLQDYIQQVYKAKSEGVKVEGYFVWSLLDNFEWAEGYHPRFGLIYVDFNTQQRTIKNSGKWYSSFLAKSKPTETI